VAASEEVALAVPRGAPPLGLLRRSDRWSRSLGRLRLTLPEGLVVWLRSVARSRWPLPLRSSLPVAPRGHPRRVPPPKGLRPLGIAAFGPPVRPRKGGPVVQTPKGLAQVARLGWLPPLRVPKIPPRSGSSFRSALRSEDRAEQRYAQAPGPTARPVVRSPKSASHRLALHHRPRVVVRRLDLTANCPVLLGGRGSPLPWLPTGRQAVPWAPFGQGKRSGWFGYHNRWCLSRCPKALGLAPPADKRCPPVAGSLAAWPTPPSENGGAGSRLRAEPPRLAEAWRVGPYPPPVPKPRWWVPSHPPEGGCVGMRRLAERCPVRPEGLAETHLAHPKVSRSGRCPMPEGIKRRAFEGVAGYEMGKPPSGRYSTQKSVPSRRGLGAKGADALLGFRLFRDFPPVVASVPSHIQPSRAFPVPGPEGLGAGCSSGRNDLGIGLSVSRLPPLLRFPTSSP